MEKKITELKLEDLQAVAGGNKYAASIVAQPKVSSIYTSPLSQSAASSFLLTANVIR